MHMDKASSMHAHVTFSSDVTSSPIAHARPLATSPRSQYSYGQNARTANTSYSLSLFSSNPGQSGVTNSNGNSSLSPPPLGISQHERHHASHERHQMSQERHHTHEVEHQAHQQHHTSHQDTLPISHPASVLTPSFPETPAHARGPLRTPDRSSHSIAHTPSTQPPDFMQQSAPLARTQRPEDSVRVSNSKNTKVVAAKQWQSSSDVSVRKPGFVQALGLVHQDRRHERPYDMREHRRDDRRESVRYDDDDGRRLDGREKRRGDRRDDRREDRREDRGDNARQDFHDDDRRLDRRESKRDDRRDDRHLSASGTIHATSTQSLDTQRSSRSGSVQSRFTDSDSDSNKGDGTDDEDARPTQVSAQQALERRGR
jgi:hypothetical protein